MLSSAGPPCNRDYLAETGGGAQQPMLNVFHRDADTLRHFWGSELYGAAAAAVGGGQEGNSVRITHLPAEYTAP